MEMPVFAFILANQVILTYLWSMRLEFISSWKFFIVYQYSHHEHQLGLLINRYGNPFWPNWDSISKHFSQFVDFTKY